MGVMMAKKLMDRMMVLTFSNARRTQYQENFSWLTSAVGFEPWASKRMRARHAECSSAVKNLMSEGVWGRAKRTIMPNTIDIAPSTKNMNG